MWGDTEAIPLTCPSGCCTFYLLKRPSISFTPTIFCFPNLSEDFLASADCTEQQAAAFFRIQSFCVNAYLVQMFLTNFNHRSPTLRTKMCRTRNGLCTLFWSFSTDTDARIKDLSISQIQLLHRSTRHISVINHSIGEIHPVEISVIKTGIGDKGCG